MTKFPLGSIALAFLLCIALSSCGSTTVTWSSDLKSPDGKYIAHGRTKIMTGPGIDGGGTTVDLNWTTGSQKPMDILILPDGPESIGEPSVLKMVWIDPTHLELQYMGNEVPIFQAVRCEGVEISLQPVSRPVNASTRQSGAAK